MALALPPPKLERLLAERKALNDSPDPNEFCREANELLDPRDDSPNEEPKDPCIKLFEEAPEVRDCAEAEALVRLC